MLTIHKCFNFSPIFLLSSKVIYPLGFPLGISNRGPRGRLRFEFYNSTHHLPAPSVRATHFPTSNWFSRPEAKLILGSSDFMPKIQLFTTSCQFCCLQIHVKFMSIPTVLSSDHQYFLPRLLK